MITRVLEFAFHRFPKVPILSTSLHTEDEQLHELHPTAQESNTGLLIRSSAYYPLHYGGTSLPRLGIDSIRGCSHSDYSP